MGISNEPIWRQAINHMLHFSFALKAEIEGRLGTELGIGLADHEALINIHLSETGLKMSDLAEQLVLSRGGITKLVDRLETAGYLRRAPSSEDRRVTGIEITPSGIDVVTRSRSVIDEIVAERFAKHITEDEAQFLRDLIRRAYHDEESTLVEE
ncbi:MAG: MarR family transcriptional regulator [bacterium]|nr:MarR family transcriptional regulator [bacterium]